MLKCCGNPALPYIKWLLPHPTLYKYIFIVLMLTPCMKAGCFETTPNKNSNVVSTLRNKHSKYTVRECEMDARDCG